MEDGGPRKKPKPAIPNLTCLSKYEEISPTPHLVNYPVIPYERVQELCEEWSNRSPINRMELKISVNELLNATEQTGAWIYKKDNNIDAAYTKFSPICTWDVSKVKDMRGIFERACNFDEDLNCWNVSNVEDMSQMFSGAHKFNNGSSNKLMWDVSNVNNMEKMFYKAYSFNNQLTGTDGETDWDVSKVRDMDEMFHKATSFNNGQQPHVYTNPLTWEISRNTTKNRMFDEACSLSLQIRKDIEMDSD